MVHQKYPEVTSFSKILKSYFSVEVVKSLYLRHLFALDLW